MSNFKFRLDKVWKHRRRVVDRNSLEVARTDRLVAAMSRQIMELDQNIARHAATMVPRPGDPVKAPDLIDGATWQNHLYDLHHALSIQLQTAVKDRERFRSRLKESWRDLEILSRLRDRQEETWRLGLENQERKEMDEIGQVRAFRHGSNNLPR